MSLKKWAIGKAISRVVRGWAGEASMGKLGAPVLFIWRLLDGKKAVLLSFVLGLKSLYPEWGLWWAVDAAARALGWDEMVPAIDPDKLATTIALMVALGHWGLKRVRERQAGIPLVDVGRSSLDQAGVIVVPTLAVNPEIRTNMILKAVAIATEAKAEAVVAKEVAVEAADAADVAGAAVAEAKKVAKKKF